MGARKLDANHEARRDRPETGARLFKCVGCGKLLREQPVSYARERHESLVVAAARRGDPAFVREATWPAYLASLRRCRCGSRKGLREIAAVPGQLPLHVEPLVVG